MTGLEKITNQIQEDAKASAEQRVAAARQEAEQLLSEARAECDALEREAAEKAAARKAGYEGRLQSSAEQQRRTALLSAKQEIISEVIAQAYTTLKEEGTADYFLTMEKILKAYALAEAGEIYFSAADLGRMPTDFEAKIQVAAKEKGGSLTLKKEPRDIPDGFILVYGGVEENCTLKALFDAKKDELQDQVNRSLFS